VLAERHADIREGLPVVVRVIAGRNVVDVFLEEALMLSVVAEGYVAGRIALVADDSSARFARMRARRIALPPVEGPRV
jgi:hypothetical protein